MNDTTKFALVGLVAFGAGVLLSKYIMPQATAARPTGDQSYFPMNARYKGPQTAYARFNDPSFVPNSGSLYQPYTLRSPYSGIPETGPAVYQNKFAGLQDVPFVQSY